MNKLWVLRLRSIAFLIDFALPTLIISTLFLIIGEYILGLSYTEAEALVLGYGMIISLMLKDLSGNSIGKRITGFKIISLIGDETPRLNQLFLRNLFAFLAPFEIVMVIFRPDHRRIGDLLANTMVIRRDQEWR